MNRLTLITCLIAALCACGEPSQDTAQTQQATGFVNWLDPAGDQLFYDHLHEYFCHFQSTMASNATSCDWACLPDKHITTTWRGGPAEDAYMNGIATAFSVIPFDDHMPEYATVDTPVQGGSDAVVACPITKIYHGLTAPWARAPGDIAIIAHDRTDPLILSEDEKAAMGQWFYAAISNCKHSRHGGDCYPLTARFLPSGYVLNVVTGVVTAPLTVSVPGGF